MRNVYKCVNIVNKSVYNYVFNLFCNLMGKYYKGMRDLHNSNLISNPMKSIGYDMRRQKWMNKVRD